MESLDEGGDGMNTSPYINPELCRDCGECCKHFDIWYSKSFNGLIRSEIARFKLLEDIGDKISVIEEAGGTWLRFNIPCKHLQKNEEGYFCEIYFSNSRPLLCRQYPHSKGYDCPHIRGGKVSRKGYDCPDTREGMV